jgi:hypothetical protein
MKVLVATSQTQGERPTDSDNCIDGELVWMIDACPASRRNPYGECCCGRSFSGMSSDEYTTTAEVREIAGLTVADYTDALDACFDAKGWCSCCTARPLDYMIEELVTLAASWPVGAVVERRVDWLEVRRVTAPRKS